uniref:Ysc84 actin-binding domain-containing protein n=1 Tax=Oncorhynchus tshawytscha TaxID=74940 RepID=A0AAZ3RU63_ONCTS
MNNPIPSNMKSEAKKAAKILREFTEISNRTGPDKLIPANILAKCQGLAIITVIKAGFMITARGGSGIVIARLADGRWSAPSAIGIAGLGGGFEIGVEVSDLVVILMQRRAVDSFSKGGNLTLGGNCTVAVGPMGRNVEADVALRSTAAVFTYCKSRGLFAGVSLEGSCLIERKDTNRKFYSQDIRASAILNGDVEPPPEADDLYCVLESYTDKYTTEWTAKHLAQKASGPPARPRAPATQRPASTYRTEAVKPSLYPSVSAFQSGSTGLSLLLLMSVVVLGCGPLTVWQQLPPFWWGRAVGRGACSRHGGTPVHRATAWRPELQPWRPHHCGYQDRVTV